MAATISRHRSELNSVCYELLGTPLEHKRHMRAGGWPCRAATWRGLFKEVLDWLDKCFGGRSTSAADAGASRLTASRCSKRSSYSAEQFKTDEDLYPLRVPRTPLALADVVHRALAEDGGHFDPLLLRSRTLLRLEWDDRGSWETWVTVLPSGLKLFCDAGEEEPHVLASGGRHANDETDRRFLQLLAESAGRTVRHRDVGRRAFASLVLGERPCSFSSMSSPSCSR